MAKNDKKKKEVELPDRAALESLAKEMNEVMGLDPKIKFNRKTTDEELIEMIRENAVDPDKDDAPTIYHSDFEEDENDPDKDVFTDEAKETLEALEIEIGDEPDGDELDDLDMDGLKEYIEENELDIKVTKKMDEDAVRELIREAEAEPEPEKEEPKGKKDAGKGKKKDEDDEDEKPAKGKKDDKKKGSKKDEDDEDEKPAKGKKGAKEEKAKPAAKKEKGEKVTRYMAVAAVLKEGKALTEEQIAEKADDLYSKKGGNSGLAQSERIVDRALQLLRALDLVEEKSGKIKYTGE